MSTTAQTCTRAPAQPATPLAPQPEPGRHYATLRRGRVYIIAGKDGAADLVFEHGKPVEVTPEVFAYLAERALDAVMIKEAGGKITDQRTRKFALRGPDGKVLPKIHSEVVTIAGEPVTGEDEYV